jgi:hypothetical protein
MEETQQVEQTSPPAAVEAPASPQVAAPQASPQAPDQMAATEPAPYSPNFKFKVMEEEKEFDEWLRPVVKDAETEKRVRELYEKAYGLDHVKAERQKIRDELKSVKTEYDSVNSALSQLSEYVNKDDLHSFFRDLGIPEQKVLQYAIQRAQYSELPPEHRQQWDRQYEEKQRLYSLERQNQELQQTFQQQAVSQRMGELDSSLQRPEVMQIVQSFDSRVGKPGAFKEEVIKRGQYYASLPTPQDISVEQAVSEVLQLVGFQQQQSQQAAGAQSGTQVVSPAGHPIIPNIKGRGTSPTKKVVRSIDDLRKLSAEI